MKKTLLLLAVVALVVDAGGCSCCRKLFGSKPKPVAMPVMTQCAPVCAPSCNPCDSANTVTYGSAPTTTFMAPSAYSGSPMTVPSQMPAGSGSR